ncbi:hypothetical protein [Deinococcus arcticus]|uniref:Uncharacterized protein n=1 Tax=Deinococcus arcticus TaxID=2136176 RepID=A0A2T3W951_9DEIO|nr:hypothetical protein [Deinococcus arcticus]PTA68283.1 hypothetical protein C8263_07490 [Deinococcus arcticus]
MNILGWLLGGAAAFGLALGMMAVRGPLALVLAGAGGGAALVTLLPLLTADRFSRSFGLAYLMAGLVATGVAALPRALAAGGASPGRELTALGLGMALVAGLLLVGVELDRLLAALLPGETKAQISAGLPGGLLVGALLGLIAGFWRR